MPNAPMTAPRTLAFACLLAVLPWQALPGRAETAKPLVVVELFTSQGCSSCPPADTYLGELATRPDLLALSFHVDYWNYIGWIDPYASKSASQRQRDYSRRLGMRYVYTPQMVINGTTEGPGTERDTIAPLIKAASQDVVPRPAVTLTRNSDGGVALHVGALALPAALAAEPATVWLVGFDREHTTKVLRGENGGSTLHDYQVVRSFREIARWTGAALDLTLAENAAEGDGGVAVLVQVGGTGRVIGAAMLRPPTS
jgi:hypothetical protein